jgi:integrase
MATIKFLLQSKSENSPIYLRLSAGRGINLKRKTGLYINFKSWSISKGLPKQNDESNKKLTDDLLHLKVSVNKSINKANIENIKINGDWLNDTIDRYFGRKGEYSLDESITYWINHIIDNAHLRENSKGGYGLSQSRINSYKGLLSSINEFREGKELRVKDLNKSKFEEFKRWLFNSKKYASTTAIKKLTDLQQVVKYADENNIPIADDFKKVKFKKVSAYDDDMDVIVLTIDDIFKIEEAKIISDALINARKWLILSCYTGQRGKDLVTRIVKSNFKKKGNKFLIEITQEKGNKKVVIPVLPKTQKIFELGLPYPISVQKLNKHIKVICEIAKIDTPTLGTLVDKETKRNVKKIRPKHKYISTHTGRRTFATIHYNKIPTPIIMKVTGHKKESTFLEYINQNHDDHIDTFMNYYNENNSESIKKPKLKIIKSSINE